MAATHRHGHGHAGDRDLESLRGAGDLESLRGGGDRVALRGAGEAEPFLEPFFSCAGDLFQGKEKKGEVRGRGVAESGHARSDAERYVYGMIGQREMCGMSVQTEYTLAAAVGRVTSGRGIAALRSLPAPVRTTIKPLTSYYFTLKYSIYITGHQTEYCKQKMYLM